MKIINSAKTCWTLVVGTICVGWESMLFVLQFCEVDSDHWQEDLAKFGYKPCMNY